MSSLSMQRGLSESVQWAVLGTALLGCVLGLIEAGLVMHGRSVAVAAALAGSETAAALRATPDAGLRSATDVATTGGLKGVQIAVTRSATGVTVRVDAMVPTFVAWVTPHVSAESTRPWEAP
ncbi:MAG: hypothetical protein FWD80_04985 [Propionibacteriaceae bacterium]|nr:hypothetical protein [Propionibacteriaceae bacterium]